MAQYKYSIEQKDYDYLQFVVPDVNNIPRGKIVKGKFKEKIAKHGMEIFSGICLPGPNFETPVSVFQVLGNNFPNENLRPCMETLTPWPWAAGSEGRRVGNVLCDLVMHDGTPDLTSPRQLMKAQLAALWDQHGLMLKSAFEYEFYIFKAGGTLERLGGEDRWCCDVNHWGRHLDLFGDLTDLLEVMGVEVSTLMPEYAPGQWELTTEPEEGVRGGDVAFYVKNAVKGFFQTRGYQATFMTKPTADQMPSGLHFNHSLWKKEGDTEVSAMLDKAHPYLLSSTARHWMAGILTHSAAITALCCPTLNCYRRLHQFCCPGKVTWGLDDRNTMVRVHTAHDNVFFENRLPSAACCPYLTIAATVAAGLDGINRQLPCPPPAGHADGPTCELPKSLAESLEALEKDAELRSLLGDRFVQCFLNSKREYELPRMDTGVLNTEEKQMELERKMYMMNL